MKITPLHLTPDTHRAILFFAGWGIDPGMLQVNAVPGYDIYMVNDYTTLEPEGDIPEGYLEIVVVAWSYGVAMAAIYLEHSGLPVTRRVAVNGTLYPVDAALGISPAIFDATLAALNERTLVKFDRRMCGGAAAAVALGQRTRPVDRLREELKAIGEHAQAVPVTQWDEAFISSGDLIIPVECQRAAWARGGAIKVCETDGSHLPDLNVILSRVTVDKDLVKERFSRVQNTYEAHASIQNRVAQTLAEMTFPHIRPRSHILEVGSGTGLLTRLVESGLDCQLKTIDLIAGNRENHIMGDAEMIPREASGCDVLLSASTLQWFNSPRRYLHDVVRYLNDNAIVGIAVYGNLNFCQLDPVIPDRRHFPTPEQWVAMLPADTMELIDFREERVDIAFDSVLEVMRHIKATGVNATHGCTPMHHILSAYPRVDGKITLTYHPVWIVARKK